MQRLVEAGALSAVPLAGAVAGTSVGVVGGEALLDLCYEEDSAAAVDFNVVKTAKGDYVEVQGTAEGNPFSRELMGRLLDIAEPGLAELFALQETAIAEASEATASG